LILLILSICKFLNDDLPKLEGPFYSDINENTNVMLQRKTLDAKFYF